MRKIIMGKMQRNKGSRIERELVTRLCDSGFNARRVPLSGMCAGYKGDISIKRGRAEYIAEVKSRASASGWRMVKMWLGDNDFLFLREDGVKEPLVVMNWKLFTDLLGEG